MKSLLFMMLLSIGTPSFAETAEKGDYVVVRGAVKGCEQTQDRIFDVVEIESSDPITLLSIPDIQVIGQSAPKIGLHLQDKIEAVTGQRPTTLRIDILQTDQEYRNILEEYTQSLALFISVTNGVKLTP